MRAVSVACLIALACVSEPNGSVRTPPVEEDARAPSAPPRADGLASEPVDAAPDLVPDLARDMAPDLTPDVAADLARDAASSDLALDVVSAACGALSVEGARPAGVAGVRAPLAV